MAWKEVEKGLQKRFDCQDFKSALELVNEIGRVAETAQHHPDICFGWGYVEITITTHSENGITEKDHSLASQIDALKQDLAN